MEADEYQDLQPGNWKPKGADGIVLDEVWKAANQGSWLWFYQNSRRLEAQKKPKFQFKSDSREKQNKTKDDLVSRQSSKRSSLLLKGGSAFLFSLNYQLIGKRSIHIREGNLLNSVGLFKCQPETCSQTHQNGIWPNACASHGPVKLMHKINHLKSSLCQLGMHTYLLKPSVIFK